MSLGAINNMFRARQLLLSSTAILGCIFTFTEGAQAQTASSSPPQTQASQAEKPKAKADTTGAVEELVVTGSRIRRSDYTSASPVTVITSETANLQGLASAADLLQTLPIAATSQQINGLLGNYVVTGGPGVQTLGLRGLGAQRTLVLLNGRRLGPAGVGGTVGPVDLNVLPDMLFDHIEILKDGASSIYGSDAVAGVVNYFTKRNADGLRLMAYADVPFKSGGDEYKLAATYGKTFDKGYISAALSFDDQKGLNKGQRKFTACDADYIFNKQTGDRLDFKDANGNYQCINEYNNAVASKYVFGGFFQYDPTLSKYPNYPAGALGLRQDLPDWVRAARYGTPSTRPYANTTSPLDGRGTIISPRTLFTGMFSAGYDLKPDLQVYTEILLNDRKTSNARVFQLFPDLDPNNPTNTMAAGLIKAATKVGGLTDGTVTPIIAQLGKSSTDVAYAHAVFGLKGDVRGLGFLDGFKWDGYYQLSASRGTYDGDFVYKDRVTAATGIDDAGNQVSNGLACNPALLTSSPASCVAIPWLDPRVLSGQFTAQERAFLFGREQGETTYLQHAVEFNITGDAFKLPAGPLGVAAGVYFKHDSIDDKPGLNARNRNYWGLTTSGITKGSESVWEGYAEILAPLIRNRFLAKSIDLSLSGRLSNYDTYGTNGTYKVGLDWAINSEFRLRGTYGTSFRAPALFEHYLADQTGFFNGVDPCARWGNSANATLRARCAAAGIPDDYGGYTATPTVTTGGGSKLDPETSKAYSVGVVWTPSYVDLKVALDYFNFDVRDEVSRFGAQNILNSCYAAVNAGPFCVLFTRDPNSHDLLTINDSYLNIARQKIRGIDVQADYRHQLRFGTLAISSQFTWQLEASQSLNGEPLSDYAGTASNPQFSNATNVSLKKGDYTFFWSFNFIGRTSDGRYSETGEFSPPDADHPNGYYRKLHTEPVMYHTVSMKKDFGNTTLYVGVQNLFDESPPAVSTGNFRVGVSALNSYDLLGRRAFIQIEKKF